MWSKSNVPIKLPSVWWCAAYMSGSSLGKSFQQPALLPCLLALRGVWNSPTRNVGVEIAALDRGCLSHEKSSSTSPLQTAHVPPREIYDTTFWPGAEGLEDHCSLWEKGGWCRNKKKKNPKLAVSVLGGLEAQVTCEAERTLSIIFSGSPFYVPYMALL